MISDQLTVPQFDTSLDDLLMLKLHPYLLSLLILLALTAESRGVDVWITSGDKSKLMAQQPDVVFSSGTGGGGVTIQITPTQQFQTMEGFGAAMTDSSAWLIQNELNTTQRDRLMNDLFSGSDGIGVSYLRVPMGASDFTASGFYTYNDLGPGQTDPNQTQFSIAHDQATIIPSLLQAKSLNPNLKLMGSPWSAPGWMKTSNSVIGGSLQTQWYASYATYLKKFVEAYDAEGLPIESLTLQNEPLYTPINYPGMSMTANEQIDLIKNHVGPTFSAAGLSTKLVAYDHNWDNTSYPIDVLNDATARQYVDGVAFHGYAGNVSAQTTVHNAHPDKNIYFTEISGGAWATNFEDNIMWNADNLFIGGVRNWSNSVMFWNLALDENHGPHLGGCNDCRGVVTIDSSTGNVTYNEEFYSLAHASRFIKPGAVRIGSTSINNLVETVAFQNPDGSEVLLVSNPTFSDQTFRGVVDGDHFRYTVPHRSVATFVWDSQGADYDNGSFEEGGYDTTGGSADGWLVWGNSNQNVEVSNGPAHAGDHSLRISGSGAAGSYAGVSQGMTVEGGNALRVDAEVLVQAADGIDSTNNLVYMKVEYYTEYDGQFLGAGYISHTEIVVADGSTTTGNWSPHGFTDIVPAGAEEARLVFVFSQPNGEAGSVYVDSVDYRVTAQLAGDFNGDGIVDAADYTLWRDNLGAPDESVINFGGDGINGVDQGDFDLWEANFGASASPSQSYSVPEPTSCGLMLFSWVMGATQCRLRTLEAHML